LVVAHSPFYLLRRLTFLRNVDTKFYLLLLNILPEWTTSGALQDREKLTKAFCEYYSNGGVEGASQLVQERFKIARKYGFSDDALARMDIGLAQALLANSVPITTWMVLRIFSSPSLLAEIHTEVEGLLVQNGTDIKDQTGLVDFTRIRTDCPLLVSVWQEVLRTTSHLPSGRTVLEDTMIQDKYLLKKDATVFIFSGVLHADEEQWGPDFNQFNPRRFLPSEGQRKVNPVAFRPFGGGHLLCPGRHLAFTEIITFVATLVLGFDVKPENGAWPSLERDVYRPSLGVYKPTEASIGRVVISRRAERKNVVWNYPVQPIT
jgi:cytochrome P450